MSSDGICKYFITIYNLILRSGMRSYVDVNAVNQFKTTLRQVHTLGLITDV